MLAAIAVAAPIRLYFIAASTIGIQLYVACKVRRFMGGGKRIFVTKARPPLCIFDAASIIRPSILAELSGRAALAKPLQRRMFPKVEKTELLDVSL